ncbi:homoserine O-acetyltransferase [Halorussus gelatinilyticus]|uniref:Homoserine O-acetyltransferase n=1 Tax=Halorussus gelatinilyticus TaxID=2937524 RepID=A0A8U0IPZ1_9EURY|nr:homoserine O-acetyltransferase [Halorussus gelatinilyticus]UPW02079.1 homoserine O-acetyltransferase [Halorussus gelatinilyticus]
MNRTRDTADLGNFEFECGRAVPLEVAYETYGEYDGRNAVLVCHALTGSAHVTGPKRAHGDGGDDAGEESDDAGAATGGQAAAWWSDVVGPGKAIDTREYFVVCANVPGSCYGTTGPASIDPETGEAYGTDFPAVTVGDWTRAQARLLDHLGVGPVHAVVGGSVGGMNVLEWAKRYPERVDRVVPIATAARLDPQMLAIDAVARRAITTDPNWNGGDYHGDDRDPPTDGLAIARQLGHVGYLSKESMDRKFGRRSAGRAAMADAFAPDDPAGEYFPYREVESYLDYQAEKFVERFDATSYLYLTRAMDHYDLSSGYDSDADALAGFSGEALVISFTGDWHFTVEQSERLADAFETAGIDAAHHVVESDHGHDAFLVEPEEVGPPLRDFLAAGVEGRAVSDADEREFAPVHASLFGK